MKHRRKFLQTLKAVAGANAPPAPADSHWERPSNQEIATAFLDLVRQRIQGAGIPGDAVAVEIAVTGRTGDGRPVLMATLKLANWSGRASIRLLLGLPLLEAKVGQSLRDHWLADVSAFAGLSLQPAAAARDPKVLLELRAVMLRLEDEELRRAPAPSQPEPGEGLWSAPAPFETLPGEPAESR